MPAFKYLSRNNNKSFLQASMEVKMGKNYSYNSRFYCQIKNSNGISCVDVNYELNVRLLSWTSHSTDVELELKTLSISDAFDDGNKCAHIINSLSDIENIPLHLRISNTGRILKVFNLSNLHNIWKKSIDEKMMINKLETNSIISAFIVGQTNNAIGSTKVFSSTLSPSLEVESSLKVASKKIKFNKANEVIISNDNSSFGVDHSLSIIASSNKGINKILPYSITYSTEEILENEANVFISIGMEKNISVKDFSLKDKLYCSLLKNMSAVF